MAGYIRLFRKLLENPLMDAPAIWMKVFIVILLRVNWKTATWWDGTRDIELPPGSMVTSVAKLARDARASAKEVRGALQYLQRAEIAAISTTSHYTLVSLKNWNAYQSDFDHEGKANGKPQGEPRAKRGQGKPISKATIEENLRREEGKLASSEFGEFVQSQLEGVELGGFTDRRGNVLRPGMRPDPGTIRRIANTLHDADGWKRFVSKFQERRHEIEWGGAVLLARDIAAERNARGAA